jgi:SAM-dependent methyltransferase
MFRKLFLLFALAVYPGLLPCSALAAQPSEQPHYEFQEDHDPDGIGKFFMGREIARVMGHRGAPWLERPEREDEEKPTLVLDVIKLKTGDSVADIGAGTGYFSWRMARAVGEKGRVYAVDIQPEMLAILDEKMSERGVTNVIPVLGTITDPKLPPGSVDLAIMVDVYHEFSHPYEMLEAICRALKPKGRVVFVEYRAEDPWVPIKRLHKMSEEQIKKEAGIHSLVWVETNRVLPRQHILIFEKSSQPADSDSTKIPAE